MKRDLEVAEVLRCFGSEYIQTHGETITLDQLRVLQDLRKCRTAAAGGHTQQCQTCGFTQMAYNSCRNRHCPKCQAMARAEWLAERESELLEVPYFHIVFTLPSELHRWALVNPRQIYGWLLQASSQTVLEVAGEPKYLGAKVGVLSVLHTWGQTLHLHPHVHCVVPAGGLCPKTGQWIGGSEKFFAPVRVLSRLFRGKFLALLRQAYAQDENLVGTPDDAEFGRVIDRLYRKDWVVYAKKPFGRPEHVLKYLARYTHRVAISNDRLLAMEGGTVSFSYKDYADGSQRKVMTLAGVEFIRRFLLHVVPSGFVRIRYFGLLANRHRQENIRRCREAIHETSRLSTATAVLTDCPEEASPLPGRALRCPLCGESRFFIIDRWNGPCWFVCQDGVRPSPWKIDSS